MVWKIFYFLFFIFWSGFCCWKFKKIAKIGFGRKNQFEPSMCSHLFKRHRLHLYHIKLKKKKTPSEGMMDVVSTWIKIMMDFSLSSFIRWPHSLAFDDNHVDQPLNHKLPYPNQAPLCCYTQTILILLVNIILKNVVS
jgi:hypothetical protein